LLAATDPVQGAERELLIAVFQHAVERLTAINEDLEQLRARLVGLPVRVDVCTSLERCAA
jgi:hypothetical protein